LIRLLFAVSAALVLIHVRKEFMQVFAAYYDTREMFADGELAK